VISVVPGLTLARTNASIDLAELSAITARRNRPERVSAQLHARPASDTTAAVFLRRGVFLTAVSPFRGFSRPAMSQ
jgi:hypothetical protein